MTKGEQIVADAWAAFEAWCKEYDPEGELNDLERVDAYSEWCNRQPGRVHGEDRREDSPS